MDMNCHPTTSAGSHLLKGVLLGYLYEAEIRNPLNCRPILQDFDSVPGSHKIKGPFRTDG
jgi:hypothetical protein